MDETARTRQPAAEPGWSEIRHFTATAFIVWRGRVLLHWHRKERLWLPMGGHIEPNEDPVQCALREAHEEAGFPVELFGFPPEFGITNLPELASPVTILLEDVIGDGVPHQHIDLIYFCRPLADPPTQSACATMRWLDATELAADRPVAPDPASPPTRVTEDVRVLALEALRRSKLRSSRRRRR